MSRQEAFNSPIPEAATLKKGESPKGRESYVPQMNAIRAKLDRGTNIVKKGHKVAGINPDGDFIEVPFSERQVVALRWNLLDLRVHANLATIDERIAWKMLKSNAGYNHNTPFDAYGDNKKLIAWLTFDQEK